VLVTLRLREIVALDLESDLAPTWVSPESSPPAAFSSPLLPVG
jgi:hypothetical protein